MKYEGISEESRSTSPFRSARAEGRPNRGENYAFLLLNVHIMENWRRGF